MLSASGRLLLAALLAAGSVGAWAQLDGEPPRPGEVQLTVGAAAGWGPAYPGSDETRTRALPVLQARWGNGWFAGTEGIGLRFGQHEPLSYGLRLGFDRGRDEGDAAALRGLGDIPARSELGAFAEYRLAPFLRLAGALRYGSGADRNGLQSELGLRMVRPLSLRHRLLGAVGATWANRASLQSRFGIDAAQSAASGHAPFTPAAGLQDVHVRLGWMVDLTPAISLQTTLAAHRLAGDARKSPLVRDATGVGAFAALVFRP